MFGMCDDFCQVHDDVLDIYDCCSFLELWFQRLCMAGGQRYLQCDDDTLICKSLLDSPTVLCAVWVYDILGPYTPAVGQPCFTLDLGSMQAQLRLLWVSDCDHGSFLYSGVLFYRSLCPCFPDFVCHPMVCGGHV